MMKLYHTPKGWTKESLISFIGDTGIFLLVARMGVEPMT